MFKVVNKGLLSTNYRVGVTNSNARSIFTGKLKVQNESKSVRGESKETNQSRENNMTGEDDTKSRGKLNEGKSNDAQQQEKSFTKTFKEMSHGSGKAPIAAIKTGKRMIVPRVPSTEYIRDDSIHIEGLFAGYRPLFLGNSSIPTEGNSLSTETESLLLKSKVDTDTSIKKLVVPWNASISGIKYKDEAFHRLPTSLVSRLRPFKFQPDPDMPGLGKKRRNEMIVMKVHNSKINDRPELVDIFNLKKGGKYHPLSKDSIYGGMTKRDLEFRKAFKKKKNDYDNELQSFAYDYKFIRDDQIRFRDTIQTLNEELIDKFEEITGLKLQLQSKEQNLPLSIYLQQNIATKRRLKSVIKSSIKFQTEPILYSLLQDFETKEQSLEFENKFKEDVKKIVSNLIEKIPSLSFVDTTKAVDCIIFKSPVPGFKRIHWLDANKRLTTMSKFNSDKEYTFPITRNQKITRTGMRSTRRPVQIYGKTVNEVFKEWDYYTY